MNSRRRIGSRPLLNMCDRHGKQLDEIARLTARMLDDPNRANVRARRARQGRQEHLGQNGMFQMPVPTDDLQSPLQASPTK